MLEFDAFQRSETVRILLHALLPSSGSTLLDVGGYPGRLRTLMPHYYWVICDPLVDAPGEQVIGDASALPFQNHAVDAAVSLDVLEHIKPECRASFIHEISRVSKQGFILSFPYQHPMVQQAEDSVRQAYEEKYPGKSHPWLEEHHTYGLPNADEIKALCQNLGLSVKTLHVGGVERWQQLQLFGLLLEDKPEGITAAKQVDQFYQTNIYPHDFQNPSYRVVITAWKEDCAYQTAPLFSSSNEGKNIDMDLQTFLHRQLSVFQQQLQPSSSQDNNSNNTVDQNTHEYITRLETGLRLWEDTCAKLNQRLLDELQWRNKIESNIMVKLVKKIIRRIRR